MLKKLFRYDMLSIRRILLPMLGAAPLLGAIGLGVMELIMLLGEKLPVLQAGMILLYIFSLLALGAVAVVVMFFIVQHFYKNFFTDEGYLTFVLPATMHEHLLAKIFSGVLWSLLSTVTVFAGLGLAVGIPAAQAVSGSEFAQFFLQEFFGEFSWYMLIPVGVMLLVQAVSEIILLYTAITLGSLNMRKHKILGSVIFYFAVNMVVGMLNSVLSGLISVLLATESLPYQTVTLLSSILSILLYSAMAAVGYVIMYRMLENKLNLE